MKQIERFVNSRQADWERLAYLLNRGRRGLQKLSAAEIEELGALYRAATSDLALAQRDFGQQQVTIYLNQLVGRAARLATHSALFLGHFSPLVPPNAALYAQCPGTVPGPRAGRRPAHRPHNDGRRMARVERRAPLSGKRFALD